MCNILIIGAFGELTNSVSGQAVKTKNVYRLVTQHSKSKIIKMDTSTIKRRPWLLFSLLINVIKGNKIIIVPCLNNLSYLFPIVYIISRITKSDVIHICIGGWQVEYFMGNERFKPHPMQLRQSKKIKAFLPEMVKVDNDLKTLLGFKNTEMFPNFRFIDENAERIETSSETLRLVFLARIDKKKGYDTIFNFAQEIKKNKYDIIIDFYGPINDADKVEFLSLVESNKSCVSYKGVLQQNEVTEHLINYDVMLLPTTIYTEGFPGTILDAYIAGIPVIATEWKHSHEFIDDEKTGFVVPFNDCQNDFNDKILEFYKDRELLSKMKESAFEKRLQYSDKNAWNILEKYL